MLDKTASYAEVHNIQFSTNVNVQKSKTKCMVFGQSKNDSEPGRMILNGKELPWVDTAKYLGTMISNEKEILETDIDMKRGRFIENANSLQQEFRWAHPAIMARINTIYNSSIYGSNLYKLSSKNLDKLFNSYSVSTRKIWGLPRETHRYLVDHLAGRHLKTTIMSNQLNFYRRLENNQKQAVRNLFSIASEDMRTTTGYNVEILSRQCLDLGLMSPEKRVTSVDSRTFGMNHHFVVTPSEEEYRVGVLNDLLSIRTQYAYLEDDQFEIEEINKMIEEVCIM